MNGAEQRTISETYDGPAGVHMSKEEAAVVYQHLPVDAVPDLRKRIKRFLENDWCARADARAEAIERGVMIKAGEEKR